MAQMSLQAYLSSDAVKSRLKERFGEKATAMTSALLSVYSGNKQLQECDPRSIMGAAAFAATLNLPITPSLGQAYIVPYRGKAQFQVGWKGYVQLAHRTGRYAALHSGKVYEGEIRGFNPVTGEPITGERTSENIIGYVAYMRLTNGFEKTLYMSVEEMESHALKYSQSYKYDKTNGRTASIWSTNFDAMASKTILKKLLSTWGILSIEMAEAMQADQSVIDKTTVTYVDNGGHVAEREIVDLDPFTEEQVDPETGEITGGNNND